MGDVLRRNRAAIAAAVFVAAAAYLLWSEHRAHALGVLPYLLLLACPLMHVFMHGGHGGHGGHGHRHDGDTEKPR
jgi:hypothetical protein